MLSGSKDRTVRRWDVGKAEEVVAGRVEFGDEVWCLASEQNEGEREAEETKRVWVGLKSGGVWRLETEGEGLKNSGVGIEGGKEGGVNAIAISVSLFFSVSLSRLTSPSSPVLFYGANEWPNTFSAATLVLHTLLMVRFHFLSFNPSPWRDVSPA